jgi:hypothetical protein
MIRRVLCAAALAAVCVTGASAHDASDDKSKVTLVYDQVLPNVAGKSIRACSSNTSRAAHRLRIPIRTPPSSTQRSWRGRSEARSTMDR